MLLQLRCLCLSSSSSSSFTKTTKPKTLYPTPNQPPHFIKFRTSHRENLRYLKTLGVIDPQTKPNNLPLPDDVDQILLTVDFLKSKGFSDSDFPRLAFLSPELFSSNLDPTDIAPVFDFLAADLSASVEDTRRLILQCPPILFSDVEYCLRPTLHYLRKLGLERLDRPTSLNAHLLNTRVEKLRMKIGFLRRIGLSYDESSRVCARVPAIFGYSIEENLKPKYEYLVMEMERNLEELKKFPQYFAFSLEKKIKPRHLHLKQRNVRIPLNRMLIWSDQRFYAKWK
ncbi:hypothetical protein FEM48_Zijuj09G0111400 [Ziziphus jujuba var. spinosa]|uniref:transcription termination factor MTEF1, chloroplastic-like n=2 Tax=Ziziphus jujuba TaxID=326968 RepID=A0A6P4BNS1_ZIZJJ|nr:hypothetical protein FEM48_Zijuj09G0111400 [Ziziphus jujuba var. spinosa]